MFGDVSTFSFSKKGSAGNVCRYQAMRWAQQSWLRQMNEWEDVKEKLMSTTLAGVIQYERISDTGSCSSASVQNFKYCSKYTSLGTRSKKIKTWLYQQECCLRVDLLIPWFIPSEWEQLVVILRVIMLRHSFFCQPVGIVSWTGLESLVGDFPFSLLGRQEVWTTEWFVIDSSVFSQVGPAFKLKVPKLDAFG